ncbi:response regulator transcription factor [Frankia sp. R82]|uniref:response regulator transcription factor n=1 Tax=Frankia sp. R82 TaxID=2950553 RepID=UPI002043CDFA|nr:response regulator transcription factor [Frankia sp. R82]MCM3886932.1 response regulator transcription factor [Frankia sp. R82]
MRVLVVEDDERTAALLRRGLVEEGYAVDLAADGPEAVWRGSEVDYDAIVLDLMLPGLDGFEVCARLRARGRWAPVLMLTARVDVDDRIRGLDSGADDYLPKPFSFGELTARLRALVRRGADRRPVILAAGPVRLDPAAHRVWRRGAPVDLSAKEFALLHLLLRHPEQVLTRTFIIDHVWDDAFDATSNIVDQYVRYLRRKIDDPDGESLIETVRGVGYRLHLPPESASSSAAVPDHPIINGVDDIPVASDAGRGPVGPDAAPGMR